MRLREGTASMTKTEEKQNQEVSLSTHTREQQRMASQPLGFCYVMRGIRAETLRLAIRSEPS